MTRIAFPLVGGEVWTGGYNYLKTTLGLLASAQDRQPETVVFLSPQEASRFGAELAPLATGGLVVDERVSGAGRGRRLIAALVTGRDRALVDILAQARVDVVFENARFYGWRVPFATIAWIPDLQHRVMPAMFSRKAWWRREIGFRAQIAARRTLLVSSQSAKADLMRYYGVGPDRVHVVRFANAVDLPTVRSGAASAREKYALPDRFFYLPNQFWSHKNHELVIAALAELRGSGHAVDLPPVVISGNPKGQNGSDEYFQRILAMVHNGRLDGQVRFLGLIPYSDVLALNAACTALINPSRFEGWSTSVEEGKALGTPLILSAIPVHREQAPEARFVDPDDAADMARAIWDIATGSPSTRPSVQSLEANQAERIAEHARALGQVILAAASRAGR